MNIQSSRRSVMSYSDYPKYQAPQEVAPDSPRDIATLNESYTPSRGQKITKTIAGGLVGGSAVALMSVIPALSAAISGGPPGWAGKIVGMVATGALLGAAASACTPGDQNWFE